MRKQIAQTLENCFSHQLVKNANYVSSVMVIVKHSRSFVSGCSFSNSSQTLSGLKKEKIWESIRTSLEERREVEGDAKFRGLK